MRNKFFKGFFNFLGIQTAAAFLFLIIVTAAAESIYPDTVCCFSGQSVKSGVFAVETSNASGDSQTEAQVKFLGIVPVKSVTVKYYESKQLIPGGMTFGVKLFTQGLLVTQTGAFVSNGKSADPAKDAGIKRGDVIVKVDGAEVTKTHQLSRLVEKSSGRQVKIDVLRDGKTSTLTLTPAFCDGENRFKAGLWVKDSAAGIGTVTYIDPETLDFAGLGHGICEQSTGDLVPISSGEVWAVRVDGVVKGEKGDPGELKGGFLSEKIGVINENTRQGVFGSLYSVLPTPYGAIDSALSDEIKPGDAEILCCVSDEGVKSYKAQIERISDRNSDTKNFIIKITDPELIKITGGIVQGMSGSPVIQNGKLVGAVTHVMVNDPTRGYGIFIEKMLEAESVLLGAAA